MSKELDALLPNPTPALKEAIAAGDDFSIKDPPLKPHQGRIRYLATPELSKEITGNGIGGHDRILWDRRYRDQIGEARDKFHELCRRGFVPHLVKKNGEAFNRAMEKDETGQYVFDPEAEEIIMIAPTAAG